MRTLVGFGFSLLCRGSTRSITAVSGSSSFSARDFQQGFPGGATRQGSGGNLPSLSQAARRDRVGYRCCGRYVDKTPGEPAPQAAADITG